MPRPKPWLGRIANIVKHLEQLPDLSLTRRDVQQLFGIGRSAATDLMDVVGIRPVRAPDGGTLVTTDALLHYLRNSHDAENAMAEAARRQRLAAQLAEASEEQKLRSIRLPVSPADQWCTLADLPNITIENGILRVAFSSPEELMADLYRLAKAAGNDWDAFLRACAPQRPEKKAC